MGIQIVMDRSGDTRHEFDSQDVDAVARAEGRFHELTARGFRAVELGKGGSAGQLLREFSTDTEETLFIPQIQGG